MDKLIYTAFNTVNNLMDNRAVRAQNLANVNVPGFRRDVGAKSVGSAFLNSMETVQSRALAIRDDNNYFETAPGTLSQTDYDMDIAIRGSGYFIVQGNGDPSLTRRGDLNISPEGLLQNGANQTMLNANLEPFQVPPNRVMKISDDGDVIITPMGAADGETQVVGRLALSFGGEVELKKFPDGEIRPVDGSAPPIDDEVNIVPQHVELSNVNITEELVNSIEDQRQYEINIKLISSASEIDEGGASLLRMPG